MSPQIVTLTGRYVRCTHCRCLWMYPVSPRWPLTVGGPVGDTQITPHLPTCAELGRIREGGDVG